MLKDTTEAFEQIYIKKLKQKTDIERALMGFSMFETARAIAKTGFNSATAAPHDLKLLFFNRFYYNDFDAKTRNKITAHMQEVADA